MILEQNVRLSEILKFKGTWREYQQRVLDELETFLEDKKLNIVAAPGAGKTTLGIEVLARLDNPALIIAPTITIRNQWKQRICEAFLSDSGENLISLDAKEIKPITIITYQLLHSVFKYQETQDKFVEALKSNGIKTIVLDEAHHLRTEWYLSVKNLCEFLEGKDFRIVSLTGTPPYDVSTTEWNNYHTLCGPVDLEISIPELVKKGDLCPHQDLLWFCELNNEDKAIINNFEKNRQEFFEFLSSNSKFFSIIKTSNLLDNLEKNVDKIYEDTDFTTSIISYLFAHDELDMTAVTLMNFLCLEKENIPQWNFKTAEILLNGIFTTYEKYFEKPTDINGKLKELNLFEASKKVNLTECKSLRKIFARNTNKIKSVKEITEIEYSTLKEDLREVVLLDYIGSDNLGGLNILSVFEELKNNEYKTGILSGSLVVLPENLKEFIKNDKITISDYCENYIKLEPVGNVNLVSVVTELFNAGKLNVIIGTQSLLGEGWDSPCINSLIIASVVGSFMLSNQMRGRAIRIDKNNSSKNANIWHLVSLSDGLDYDIELMENRFRTFEGVSFVDNTIQNGLERMGIDYEKVNSGDCKKLNEIFEQRAKERSEIKNKWQQVFEKSVITEEHFVSQVYGVIKSPKIQMPVLLLNHKDSWCFKNIFIPAFVKYKSKKMQDHTKILIDGILHTLFHIGIIKTPPNKICVKNFVSTEYIPYVTLSNCTNYERECFIGIFDELYSIPQNQRYILKHQEKYLTVPDIIATNKKNVKVLAKNLEPYFGYLDIIYTRTPNGRKEQLKAKFNPLIDEKIKTGRIWM
ncbi:DEAD/DEAH box helicase family protein [bacterium]|nr:DEAD/DEAH box helicase family protein [bacterium]